ASPPLLNASILPLALRVIEGPVTSSSRSQFGRRGPLALSASWPDSENRRVSFPVATSHCRTVASWPTLSRVLPSGRNERNLVPSPCRQRTVPSRAIVPGGSGSPCVSSLAGGSACVRLPIASQNDNTIIRAWVDWIMAYLQCGPS